MVKIDNHMNSNLISFWYNALKIRKTQVEKNVRWVRMKWKWPLFINCLIIQVIGQNQLDYGLSYQYNKYDWHLISLKDGELMAKLSRMIISSSRMIVEQSLDKIIDDFTNKITLDDDKLSKQIFITL